MINLKQEGSNPSALSEITHLSHFAQAVYIEQLTANLLQQHLPVSNMTILACYNIESQDWCKSEKSSLPV
jgi:hypothetical protein